MNLFENCYRIVIVSVINLPCSNCKSRLVNNKVKKKKSRKLKDKSKT